jgi:hypothetical protein
MTRNGHRRKPQSRDRVSGAPGGSEARSEGRPGRRIIELWSDVPAAKVELENWLLRELHLGYAFRDGLSGVPSLTCCSLFVLRRSAPTEPAPTALLWEDTSRDVEELH